MRREEKRREEKRREEKRREEKRSLTGIFNRKSSWLKRKPRSVLEDGLGAELNKPLGWSTKTKCRLPGNEYPRCADGASLLPPPLLPAELTAARRRRGNPRSGLDSAMASSAVLPPVPQESAAGRGACRERAAEARSPPLQCPGGPSGALGAR
ncbi:unnamed protein product [Pleuronectes platessa]|uniref:Uncharacterized protein n=1 Tax=Pleuronectes platessa TaxID=8262 RepID=A0A9N7Y8U7_PLEPL|nr:unnamed protein product [Pleuronectes platessa]